jgi:SEC-C motif-containing protein
MESCPCGASLLYSECCEPFISGVKPAPTAEALMRSRYTAYTRKEVDYIVRTTHPDQRKQDSESNIRQWAQKSVWHQLEILNIVGGGSDDPVGSVEFIAEYSENDERVKHHELAQFKKENGIWFFWDGGPPKPKQFIRQAPKTGRNDPCPCGSGKKFKKCCG